MRKQTQKEETLNSISHGIGALLSLLGVCTLVILSIIQRDYLRVFSFSIYGISLITLYLCSSLYHGIKNENLKSIFRILDHSAIYLLIAGSYTPFCLVSLKSFSGWVIFCILWSLTIIGVILKIFFTGKFDRLSTMIYLAMGWTAVIIIKPFIIAITLPGFMWVLMGGLAYSFGVIFYALEKVPFCHTIWHFFVMGGSLCHFLALLFYVLPK